MCFINQVSPELLGLKNNPPLDSRKHTSQEENPPSPLPKHTPSRENSTVQPLCLLPVKKQNRMEK